MPTTLTLSEEERNHVSELLALVYWKAGAKLAKSRHNAHDVFNHRVRFCAGSATLGAFVSRLANKWGIQSLSPRALELVTALEPVEAAVLHYLSTEHIPACARAIIIVQRWREERDKANGKAKRAGDDRDTGATNATASLWDGEDREHADAAPDDALGS